MTKDGVAEIPMTVIFRNPSSHTGQISWYHPWQIYLSLDSHFQIYQFFNGFTLALAVDLLSRHGFGHLLWSPISISKHQILSDSVVSYRIYSKTPLGVFCQCLLWFASISDHTIMIPIIGQLFLRGTPPLTHTLEASFEGIQSIPSGQMEVALSCFTYISAMRWLSCSGLPYHFSSIDQPIVNSSRHLD